MASPSSAPSWSLVAQTPEPIHSFRRALAGAEEFLRPIAKASPRGDTHTPTQSPANNLTSSDVVSIEEHAASHPTSLQSGATVQRRVLTDTDADILDALVRLGGIASAKEIARAAHVHEDTTRRRLDRLRAHECVELTGRGSARRYAITETGKASL